LENSALKNIVLICVNYNTDADTRNFVASVQKILFSDQVDIVIANNSAKNDHDAALKDLENQNTMVVNIPENLGYFGGAQAAWECYQKTNFKKLRSGYPLVIVSNVDIEFPDSYFFEKLKKIKIHSDIGVLAASIISDLSQRDCNPFLHQRPSRLRMHFYKWIFSNYLSCQLYQLLGLGKLFLKSLVKIKQTQMPSSPSTLPVVEKPNDPLHIYAAHGCMMIFTPSYFNLGGNFVHGAFLYGEEITVAEFCRKHHLGTIYLPELKARHREHGSTGLFYSRSTIRYIGKSSRYIADTYFS